MKTDQAYALEHSRLNEQRRRNVGTLANYSAARRAGVLDELGRPTTPAQIRRREALLDPKAKDHKTPGQRLAHAGLHARKKEFSSG